MEFNTPDILLVGQSATVQLVIKTDAQRQLTSQLFEGISRQVTATTALVANNVSAELFGSRHMMEITLRGDKMRTITQKEPITWAWDVKPLKPGKVVVEIALFSHVNIGKEDEPVEVRVMQETWTLEARGLEWAKYWISEILPVQGFLSPLGNGFWTVFVFFLGLRCGRGN